MDMNSLAHTKWDCKYHIVFAPKFRRKDKGRKWQYQANYTMGIYICLDFFRYIGDEPPDTEEKIRHYILPIRPNRADRRKVTPKPAVYFLYRVA